MDESASSWADPMLSNTSVTPLPIDPFFSISRNPGPAANGVSIPTTANHAVTQQIQVQTAVSASTYIQKALRTLPPVATASTKGQKQKMKGVKMAFKDWSGDKSLSLGVEPSGLLRPTSIIGETVCGSKKANPIMPRDFNSRKSPAWGWPSIPVVDAKGRGVSSHLLNPSLLNRKLQPDIHPLAAAAADRSSNRPTSSTSNFSAKERCLSKSLQPHEYTVGRFVFIRNIKKRGQGWRGHAGLIIEKWGKVVAVLISTTFNGQGRDGKYEAMKYDHTGKWTEYGQHQYNLYTAFYLLLALDDSDVIDRLPVMQILNSMIFDKGKTWLDLRAVRFVHEDDLEKYLAKGSQREAFLMDRSMELLKDHICQIIDHVETGVDVWPWKDREFEMMKKWRDADEGRLRFPEEEPEWDDNE
ncbi:hypothetical protein SLS56_006055 [Neofusicoccum ribis]|uniref:Uncharacterized protein n=1 Tax=Neofusicoccum ribis TaxID=45134 RepID=A0ABR3SSL4_9PEZI